MTGFVSYKCDCCGLGLPEWYLNTLDYRNGVGLKVYIPEAFCQKCTLWLGTFFPRVVNRFPWDGRLEVRL